MTSTYRYLGTEDANHLVLDWFRSQDQPNKVIDTPWGYRVWFYEVGDLCRLDNGQIDVKRSPLVSIFPVRTVHSILLTVGEVHFLTTGLSKSFPDLAKVNRNFRKWLRQNELVFSIKNGSEGRWHYYLEGTVKNRDTDVLAFPSGINALESGQYFVSDQESDARLDALCNQLALRGVPVPPG